ncbi:MAG TPA: cupin domain-containing protein [Candidatus Binatia bacterium]|nr:cupin domain-containing protein [Candidatus Binatia bacterium]
MSARPINIKNIDELPLEARTFEGETFRLRRQLGVATGSKQLGVHYCVLQPDHSSAPLHCHTQEEEFVYVLSGRMTLRLGDERYEVRAGDAISFLPGEKPHCLVNETDADCVYLDIGTRSEDEEVLMPEAGRKLIRQKGQMRLEPLARG